MAATTYSGRPNRGTVARSAERGSRDHLHYCRDRLHAIAAIITFTSELQQNIIPNATRTSEGFTSFPRCYPTLMKVRETLTNLITSTDDADVILAYPRSLMVSGATTCPDFPFAP